MFFMKYISNPFKKVKCEECGKNYDYLRDECPSCKAKNNLDDPKKRSFSSLLPIGPVREIVLFLFGFVLLTCVAQIIGVILLTQQAVVLRQSGLSGEELTNALAEYSSTANFSMILNDSTYITIFVAMLLFLWKDNIRLFKSFLSYKVLVGLGFGFALIILSSIWGIISEKLGAGTNINQGAVESTVVLSPALAIIVTGLVAPFVEELTYRVGAFTFLKRINTVLAYVVVSLVFGLIHMKDFSSLNEWLSFPSYLIAGLCLSFAYDKFGFSASFSAHALNNLLSVILVLAQQK